MYGVLCIHSGVRQGRVISPPVAHANEQAQDGVLVYNEGPASFNCSFGNFQVCWTLHAISCFTEYMHKIACQPACMHI